MAELRCRSGLTALRSSNSPLIARGLSGPLIIHEPSVTFNPYTLKSLALPCLRCILFGSFSPQRTRACRCRSEQIRSGGGSSRLGTPGDFARRFAGINVLRISTSPTPFLFRQSSHGGTSGAPVRCTCGHFPMQLPRMNYPHSSCPREF
ncbi:hypothetical protein BOTBODRAFT_312902 [Botryobasidium botryosum FD-172 SS1]|uniref:Uncharacterized protein n=1 Tax=Botryobasidium botryosum (strain FD-172 SS1) TaxID=930990 RepID=A0A067MYB2_BOTB1|nr:hypothetical protein BOTBODRAFT_312902 [Botryobasidium botryosum FD-172 SS1]